MFTGIVKGLCSVSAVERHVGGGRLTLQMSPSFRDGLELGASVAINGCCLTVVAIEGDHVYFDLLTETLERTNLSDLKSGQEVNVERSARFGDEIGGHILSGHIATTATIDAVEVRGETCVITFFCSPEWHRYLFSKGFVALDGASLTLVEVDRNHSTFTVHLIPETRRLTTFGQRQKGDRVNLEVDSTAQAIVETLERMGIRQPR